MRKQEHSLFFGVDKITVLTYALLVLMGWLNIYAAVYNEDHQNIFDTTQKYGKQLKGQDIKECTTLENLFARIQSK